MKIVHSPYFTDAARYFIDLTIAMLEKYTFTEEQHVVIDGSNLGSSASPYEVHIFHHEPSYYQVAFTKKGSPPDIYMFAIFIHKENGENVARVVHHSHGPFPKIYDFEYECIQ